MNSVKRCPLNIKQFEPRVTSGILISFISFQNSSAFCLRCSDGEIMSGCLEVVGLLLPLPLLDRDDPVPIFLSSLLIHL